MASPKYIKHIDPASVIIGPRITEKASVLAEKNVYSFNVTKVADKTSVKAAIKALYKVSPIDVRFISIPAKTVISRGRLGKQNAIKKAYVELKKGETIEFV